MPGIETQIWLAIKSRVDALTLTYGPLFPSVEPAPYTRAWPGETFTPPSSGSALLPYLRIGRVSATPTGPLIAYGTPNVRTGSLIITLVHPLVDTATGYAASVYDEIAAKIALHFADGTSMRYDDACVTVTEYPHVQEGYLDAGYWNVPITVPWRAVA